MAKQPSKNETGMEYSTSQSSRETGTAKAKSSWGRDFIDSFKRNENSSMNPPSRALGPDGSHVAADVEAGGDYQAPLAMELKSRHLQMIAIGGSIGTGLFVGSGPALAMGGPASLLICFSVIGFMLFCTVQALGEMAVTFPVAGSFSAYSSRFLDPAWGFAMGWNYALQWLVTLPLEIMAASITIGFWTGARDISPAVWVTIFLVLIIVINFFGVKGYGEAEFVFSIIKIAAVIGFIILGIVIIAGGTPNHVQVGSTWLEPGAFNNGIKGLLSVFVTAGFAFGGTELVGLAAAEAENPRKTLPRAIKQVFWRVLLFYLISLSIIGLLVPYNDKHLLNGKDSADVNASPFVIAINNAGIVGADSAMNVVIMIAVLSVGNSAVYGSSRTLAALADQGHAPKIFGYIDRAGRPLVSIIFASSLGFLCYIVLAGNIQRDDAFSWLMAVSGLSSIFTWGSICLCHIRYRAAWKAQGRSLDDIAFRSQAGVIGSWIGFLLNLLVVVAQLFTAVAPVYSAEQSVAERVQTFFKDSLSFPIVIFMYLGYKLICKTKIQRSKEIDLVSGVRDLNVAELNAEERAEKATWPFYKRWYNTLC